MEQKVITITGEPARRPTLLENAEQAMLALERAIEELNQVPIAALALVRRGDEDIDRMIQVSKAELHRLHLRLWQFYRARPSVASVQDTHEAP